MTIRLNLGSGYRPIPGFTNCDLHDNWCKTPPDVVCDVTKPLPFPDDHADEIHAYHLFEHVHRWEADDMLKDWIRVLKPGGLLVLELPCLDKILALFDHYIQAGKPINYQMTMWGLYGDPKWHNPAMCHKWCYSEAELGQMMERHGLSVEVTEPQTHQKVRDMRLEGRKCTPQ